MQKTLLFLLFLTISSWLFGQKIKRTIKNPVFSKADVENLFITEIKRTKSNTIVFLKYKGQYLNEVCAGKDFYIRDCNTNTKYKLVKANNIPICPNQYSFSNNLQALEFNLIFPVLPPTVKIIDIIENEDNESFNFYGVDLTQSITEETELARFKTNFEQSNVPERKYDLVGNLAMFYLECNMFDKFPAKIKEITGESEYYAHALLLYGNQKRASYKYVESITADKKAGEIYKHIFGENSIEYAISLSNLAFDHCFIAAISTQNYQESIKLWLMSKKIHESKNVKENGIYSTILQGLATVYFESEEFEKSISIALEAQQLNEILLGPNSLPIAENSILIATNYAALGNHTEAIANIKKALEILNQTNAGYELLIAKAYSTLGLEYSEIGLYENSFTELQKAIKILENFKESYPFEYATALNNLGKTYLQTGEFVISRNLFIEAKKIIINFGSNNKFYQATINNLAISYMYMGDLKKSENTFLELLKLLEKSEIDKGLLYALALSNLSLIHIHNSDYNKALQNYYECELIYKKTIGENNERYASNLAKIALLEAFSENYLTAENYINKAEGIMTNAIGQSNTRYYAELLTYKSAIYFESKKYQKAIEALEEASNIIFNLNKEYNWDYTKISFDIAYLFGETGNFQQANKYIVSSIPLLKNNMIKYFSEFSEKERSLFWDSFSASNDIYKIALNTLDDGCSPSFDFSLFSKGILLNTSIELHKLLSESDDQKLVSDFENLRSINAQINKQYEKPLSERTLNVDSLQEQVEKIERYLLKESNVYGDFTHNLTLTWQDVQAKLNDNDIAIEFVNFYANEDTTMYAALALRKGWTTPKIIPLFVEKDILELSNKKPDLVYGNHIGKQLSKHIWMPLFEYINKGDNVYFSPSGVLYQLAIESLPINDSTIMSQRNNLFRFSTTKQLCYEKSSTNITSAVLYGGLKYDMDEKPMLAQSNLYPTDELYASRGFMSDLTIRSGWNYLPATKKEVENIAQLLKKNTISVKLYEGEKGNEESFKNLSGKKTSLIHIATHGFFLPNQQAKKQDYFLTRNTDLPVVDNSLLRSGILMSGGNKAWQGKKIPEKVEDGVMSAKEIANLDLRGTSLLVLSACETGLGEITSDGVFGLQRAFKKAGVQTIIMSLWKVDDKATELMMTEFYTNLSKGLDKRNAFLEAQNKTKDVYKSPYYWASFIMLD